MSKRVPTGVVERLPLYLDCLLQVAQTGTQTVSSAKLGEMTGINPAQIRRDLTHFGSFGQRGKGYRVDGLVHEIQRILGSDHIHRIALVGAGNLGTAVAGYSDLRQHGFVVSGIFDKSRSRVGSVVAGITVQNVDELEETVRGRSLSIGIIAVPPAAAQEVADRLAGAGVRVILNYTPVAVSVPAGVTLHNTEPVHELLHTLYYLSAHRE